MSSFINKAEEALHRAEKDLEDHRNGLISPDYPKVAELEIQISASWTMLHNLKAMDS